MDTNNHLRWKHSVSCDFCLCEFKERGINMDMNLIYGGQATLEDLYRLHELGFEFVVEGGVITDVLHR